MPNWSRDERTFKAFPSNWYNPPTCSAVVLGPNPLLSIFYSQDNTLHSQDLLGVLFYAEVPSSVAL